MKVHIVGAAPGWEKVPSDGIKWGFNTHIMKTLRNPYNVIFDMHDIKADLGGEQTDSWYVHKKNRKNLLLNSLKECERRNITVFTLGKVDGFNCVPYPIEKIKRQFYIGKDCVDYFIGGVSYAIALAIYQGFKEIHIWGVWMEDGEEHQTQKPSIEFWIGVALGRNIKVHIHGKTRLLVAAPNGLMYGYNSKQERVKNSSRKGGK